MVHRNKKAVSIILMVFEILVVLLVVGSTWYAASKYATSPHTQKVFATEDLRMMVNALVAVPGDAVVRYPQNVSSYVFVLTSNEIIGFLQGEEKNELSKVRLPLFLPEGHTAGGSIEGKDFLCLEKKNKYISLILCPEKEGEESKKLTGEQA